ncbi:hypothetical protein INR49_010148 [Caranx melampygus]|nr:hypothetical protein INR49_010148 [Caranx melampygus]
MFRANTHSSSTTGTSYHRLRGCSVSGTLRRAAPSSMKKADRRRDARKPGRHKICSHGTKPTGPHSTRTAMSDLVNPKA